MPTCAVRPIVSADLADNAGLKQAARANDKDNFAVPSKRPVKEAPGNFFRHWMLNQV